MEGFQVHGKVKHAKFCNSFDVADSYSIAGGLSGFCAII